MKHTTLIAIAVGSVLGAALPAAYADGEPVTAPSPENQQRQHAAVVGDSDTQAATPQAAATQDGPSNVASPQATVGAG